MRKPIACLTAAATFCIGGSFSAAHAQDAAEPAEEATAEESEGDQIVVEGEIEEGQIERCRIIRVTGTRFRERVCFTQNEMDEQRQNNRDVINDHRYDGPGPVEVDDQGIPIVPPI